MSLRSAICSLFALVALTVSGSAIAQPARPAAPASPAPPVAAAAPAVPATKPDDGYVMGPDDVIEVEVLGRTDFRVRAKIGIDGSIQLPLIGPTKAASRTALQLADDVKASLEKGGYYRNPIIRVEVVGFASRYVTVLGSVGTPGLVPVDRSYRVSEIIARVGGVRPTGADYVVITPQTGDVKRLSIKALATGDNTQDPYVSPGDKLFVPEAELFYISGQVKAPGAYPVSENMTLRMAIAKGGGLTDIGSEKGIKVTHKDGRVEKPGMNAKISAEDVINVGERLF